MACFNPRARVGRDTVTINVNQLPGEFQSTRPRGARLDVEHHFGPADYVSIHAPAWGATVDDYDGRFLTIEFQSTRPRGARLPAPWSCLPQGTVSIHAPAWGATVGTDQASLPSAVSIHAPAWGATVSS